ncbi:MAG: manganese efflux pump MntP family protein [Candidatus Cloacimonetes bacterium]|nr:manganese efflux pump MntP family protein [Candidatus Cloacimonadota bacterium]MCF7814558.1 manganese efflux pump MntP family protein [Candidatus Cloacimonadota bacterium]MCF7867776.1 manganese efflux pump MntP family protein [Candidatus Cloacimonadota bacterium]MCF7883246.1 manganese efflux pump MntP family protein [Candidatus Cloacimonadota bacterium]
MDFITIFVIAVGLAMDAFAVSIASGVTLKCFRAKPAFRVAIFFGGFQALMPVLGWLAGSTFHKYIQAFDHWVAFGLLVFIGGKMIYESFMITEAESKCNPNNIKTVFILAIATSIDALAVGLSFSVLNVAIIEPVIIIGIVTFILSLLGVYIGGKFGSLFENKIELIGGLVLIGIGIKILIEHLLFI